MKNKPHLLLIILAIILAFVLGVRYGQSVEKNNKTIDYLLSITPYPTYTPYPTISQPPSKTATTSPTIKLKP